MSPELEGDPIAPSSIVLPELANVALSGAGIIFLSGAKVWFHTGSAFEVFSSS
jgi:hypothetical protein